MIQMLNDSEFERLGPTPAPGRVLVPLNVTLVWLSAAAMAGVAVVIGHGNDQATYLGALAVGRSLVVAALVTRIAARRPNMLPIALVAAGAVQLIDGLDAALWGQWGGLSAFALAAVHLASARVLRSRR